ncbi:MAG: hypothetical protein ABSA97_02110 [Verrucomicrobiia bacterium]
MKNSLSAFRLGILVTLATGMALAVSCSQPAPVATPPLPPAPEVGRFQIVVTAEGERGSVLFLVDTKEGATWIYRPPQGPAVNGFWSDIPRVTYGGDFWQRAFSQIAQQPAPPSSTPSRATNAPAPSVTNR